MSTGPEAGTTTGAVLRTLLVTDLVDSTKLVEELGDERAFQIFSKHDAFARDLLLKYGGTEIDKTDGFLHLFDRPIDAVYYCIAYHQACAELSDEVGVRIAARAGIHLGEVFLRENPPEYVARGAKPLEVEGLAKPMAARLMSLGLGRQTLLTQAAFDLSRRAAVGMSEFDGELQWLAHGEYLFKGVDEAVPVFEVGIDGLSPLRPPVDTPKVKRASGDETILGWRPAPGLEIPDRSDWHLDDKLGESTFGESWTAVHAKSGDRRIFSFCFDPDRLKTLQREVEVFRVLKDQLGKREDIARIIDWRFEKAPYFLELEFTEGGNLMEWVDEQGGLENVPLEIRLTLIAQVADAVAAAHSASVVHRALRPSNILIAEVHGQPRARLTDFEHGQVLDESSLKSTAIRILSDDDRDGAADESIAHRLYAAPEVLSGYPATIQSDIYALGALTYQLAVGDLSRAVAPGWERDVNDSDLRRLLSDALDGSPVERMQDAAAFAQGLRDVVSGSRRTRRRITWGVAALILVALAIAGYFAFYEPDPIKEAGRLWDQKQYEEAVQIYRQQFREDPTNELVVNRLVEYTSFTLSTRPIGSAGKLKVLIWEYYLGQLTVPLFEIDTNIDIELEEYTSIDELADKFGRGGYDVVVAYDRFVRQKLESQALMPLDRELLPNFDNLDNEYTGWAYDPQNNVSVPYLFGTVAILYNSERMEEPPTSWAAIFDPEQASRYRIVVPYWPREMMGAAMKYLGMSFNASSDRELAKVEEAVAAALPHWEVLPEDAEVEATQSELMLTGEVDMMVISSGFGIALQDEMPSAEIVVPEEGTQLYVDNLVIPSSSENPEDAHAFINHVLDGPIGAELANLVKFATPNGAARQLLPEDDAQDPGIYPPLTVLNRCELDEADADLQLRLRDTWQRLVGVDVDSVKTTPPALE